jgi:hypothetical protein
MARFKQLLMLMLTLHTQNQMLMLNLSLKNCSILLELAPQTALQTR